MHLCNFCSLPCLRHAVVAIKVNHRFLLLLESVNVPFGNLLDLSLSTKRVAKELEISIESGFAAAMDLTVPFDDPRVRLAQAPQTASFRCLTFHSVSILSASRTRSVPLHTVLAASACAADRDMGVAAATAAIASAGPILPEEAIAQSIAEASNFSPPLLDDAERQVETSIRENAEALECLLCSNLFFRPVATTCGHIYCLPCLQRALDHRPSCPVCRADLSPQLARRSFNPAVGLDLMITKCFPVLEGVRLFDTGRSKWPSGRLSLNASAKRRVGTFPFSFVARLSQALAVSFMSLSPDIGTWSFSSLSVKVDDSTMHARWFDAVRNVHSYS